MREPPREEMNMNAFMQRFFEGSLFFLLAKVFFFFAKTVENKPMAPQNGAHVCSKRRVAAS